MSVADADSTNAKLSWRGEIVAVQPRIRLIRSFDERSHAYLGYVLRLHGHVAGAAREFTVGIGKVAQAKHAFRAGDKTDGVALPVADPRLEPVEYYKASTLKIRERPVLAAVAPPPWLGVPPTLEAYRERGHRRLDTRTYEAKCRCCIWGCRMPVEIILDKWNPAEKRYRFETFCYGPKSCRVYRAGPTRKVPGRRGMQWEEEDWVDEEATAHRGPDD
jgi:hypothetical protein